MADEFEASVNIVAPDAGELERAAEAALRPKRLSEFVGQKVVRDQLQLVLDAARARGERRPWFTSGTAWPRQDNTGNDHRC